MSTKTQANVNVDVMLDDLASYLDTAEYTPKMENDREFAAWWLKDKNYPCTLGNMVIVSVALATYKLSSLGKIGKNLEWFTNPDR